MERKNLLKTLDVVASTVLVTETVLFLNSPGFQEMIKTNPILAVPAIIGLGYLFGRFIGSMPVEGADELSPIAKKGFRQPPKPKK